MPVTVGSEVGRALQDLRGSSSLRLRVLLQSSPQDRAGERYEQGRGRKSRPACTRMWCISGKALCVGSGWSMCHKDPL